MADYYSSSAQWSSNYGFVVYVPSSTGLPSPSYYWYVVLDSSNNYYLMPFASSNTVCSNITNVTVNDNGTWYDPDIDFSQGNSFYYKLSPLDTGSSVNRFSTDFRRPVVSSSSNMSSLCNSVKSWSSFNANRVIINTFSYDESSNSGSGSYDDTNLISAILMIPATIICLACMACIFKMFINKRVRG